MRFISTVTERTEALMAGTPEQQMQAHRERHGAEVAHAIVSTKIELRRSDLEFGPRWIEHLQTGDFFWIFGRDPSFAPNVDHYFVARDGTPTMLGPADPSSRAELERKQARKEQRRAEREATARERREQIRAGAR